MAFTLPVANNITAYIKSTARSARRRRRIPTESIDTDMGYWIYGDKVLYLSSKGEEFAYIVESDEHVKLMQAQHNIIWNLSKPIQQKEDDVKAFLQQLKSGKSL